MRYAYPADIQEAPDGVTVTFPDVPEAITSGTTVVEALGRASDALATGLSFYIDDLRPVPRPSAADGRPLVSVSALEAAKLALHDAMMQAGVSNVDLAARMGVDEKAVRRLRDPLRRSHITTVERALRLLGKRIEVSVEAAAP